MPSPERVQWAKFRSSVVAVVALAVLSVLVYLLSGGTWLTEKAYLTTYLPDSTGLDPGADVQLNGVEIGKVEWVRLTSSKDPTHVVQARLKVEARYLPNIPDDSLTGMDSANLLGDQYINITMGNSPNPVRDGGELRYRPPSNIMQNIDMAQFEAQLRTIDQTIIDVQAGKGPLGAFVVSDTLYQQFVDGVVKVEKKMRAATTSQSQLGQVLYSASLHDDFLTTVRQLDSRLEQLQGNPMLRDSSQYDRLHEQVVKLRNTLADLNAGKGAGGRLLSSDATYGEWSRRLAAWIEAVDVLNSGQGSNGHMLASAQAYDSLNGSLRELAATAKEFREHPQKFLRLKIF